MTTRQSRKTQRRLQWLFRVLILLAMLLTLISIIGYALATRNYASHSGFQAQNGKPLKIVATRGEIIALSVEVAAANRGHWATDQGILLTLDGVKAPLVVVGPKPKDWGDTVSGETADFLTLTGSVTIPSSISGPQMRTLSGQLTGTLLYPGAGLISFQEETATISVPLQLQLVPPGMIEGRFLFDAFSSFTIVWCGVLFIAVLLLFIRSLVAPVYRGSIALENLGGGIFVGIIGALLLWGLFWLSTSIGTPTPLNDEISHRNLLTACIEGGSLLLIYISIVADLLN